MAQTSLQTITCTAGNLNRECDQSLNYSRSGPNKRAFISSLKHLKSNLQREQDFVPNHVFCLLRQRSHCRASQQDPELFVLRFHRLPFSRHGNENIHPQY